MSIIVCPSGLSGRIRGMKVQEARQYSSGRGGKGDSLGRLLSACWEETVDFGVYDFPSGQVDWSRVTLADRLFILLKIRIKTHGADYEFSVTCKERTCRCRIDWELSLEELPFREMGADIRDVFQQGNRFETALPSADRHVWLKLLLGADEDSLARLRRGTGELDLLDLLNFRVVEVEEISPQEKRQFIEELSMSDADFLVDEFDRIDCGVDTEIEIECPRCFASQDIELPFDKTFFMPGKGRKARLGRGGSFRR